MKQLIFIDKINHSFHGGVEKNTLEIHKNLQKTYSNIFVVKDWKDFFGVFWKSISDRNLNINYFTFKGSALRCLLIIILLPRVKLFIRINNSPEAYLYWRGLRSIISFAIRIILLKKKNVHMICNSKSVMDFYLPFMATNQSVFLPNHYGIVPAKELERSAKCKIFAASRLSPEKRYSLTLEIFSSLSKRTSAEVKYFTSSGIQQPQKFEAFIFKYENLKIDFNDTYISLSAFEGMPNMAIEALLKGAKLILSNCWAHSELKEYSKQFELSDRVTLLETIEADHVQEVILRTHNTMIDGELELVQEKIERMRITLSNEFDVALNKVCDFIND